MTSQPSRRSLLARALRTTAVLGAALTVGLASAQSAKPVRILVGFPPGGGSDAIARLLAEKLKDELHMPVLVENRPGAGGQIAAQALKAAPADGHTLFLSHDHTISILPQVVKNPGYDPVHDFVSVGGFATFVNAFAVSGGTPAKSFTDYVAWVKAQGKGKGAVGIPAPASTPEFLVKLVAEKYQIDLVSAPYRGSAPMMADMLGNQIAAGVGRISSRTTRRARCMWWPCSAPAARPPCPMCPRLMSWASRALKTCRTTASTPPQARRRSSWWTSPTRWPRWSRSRMCTASSPPWGSPWGT